MTAGVRLTVIVCTGIVAAIGWGLGGIAGGAGAFVIAVTAGVMRWRGRPSWSWLVLWARRHRPMVLRDPVTVANDRAGGGVRYQDGVAAVAVQVLGRSHAPTLFTGSTSTQTANTLDIAALVPLLRQSLGLAIESVSVVSAGARRRATGDYPRVYDTLLGTPPYAGRRETWLMVRVAALDNLEALRWRTSAGAAALAAAQRIGAALRQRGVRAKVATATDVVALERRLGAAGLNTGRRRWRSLRGDTGWLTTYCYRADEITTERLAQTWAMPVDHIVQNVTIFGDGAAAATVTVETPQPPTAPPSVVLQPLPGQQAHALVANLCGPRPALTGVERRAPAGPLVIPVGGSGVLLGKTGDGDRLLLPLDDPGELTRIHLAAEDSLAKRIIVRLAAAGEHLTVHTRDRRRWDSVRMPGIVITDRARSAAGTTVGVTDGTVTPAPRPNTVITVAEPSVPPSGATEVTIVQTGPATVQVVTDGEAHVVEIELFRAESRYTATPYQTVG